MAITKLISILSALAFSNMALGQQVPNTFQPGNPIVASEVNANFDALEAEIAVLKAQVETLQSSSGNALPQYVGVSSGTIDGGQGIRAMTELCHADYPGSRMCMTEEYVKTSNFPTAEAGASAWINPSQLVADSDGWTDNYTGIFLNTPYKLNCRAWGSSSSGWHESGTKVLAGGSFSNTLCHNALPVACCK